MIYTILGSVASISHSIQRISISELDLELLCPASRPTIIIMPTKVFEPLVQKRRYCFVVWQVVRGGLVDTLLLACISFLKPSLLLHSGFAPYATCNLGVEMRMVISSSEFALEGVRVYFYQIEASRERCRRMRKGTCALLVAEKRGPHFTAVKCILQVRYSALSCCSFPDLSTVVQIVSVGPFSWFLEQWLCASWVLAARDNRIEGDIDYGKT